MRISFKNKKGKRRTCTNTTVDTAPEDAISEYEQTNYFSEQLQAGILLQASEKTRKLSCLETKIFKSKAIFVSPRS